MKINIQPHCGNAPKKEFIRDFNIAFAGMDLNFLENAVTEDIVWEMVGGKTITGKTAFVETLKEMLDFKATELTLNQIITHGAEGAGSGSMKFEDGTTVHFADMYRFNGAKGQKIKTLTSYAIEVKTTGKP